MFPILAVPISAAFLWVGCIGIFVVDNAIRMPSYALYALTGVIIFMSLGTGLRVSRDLANILRWLVLRRLGPATFAGEGNAAPGGMVTEDIVQDGAQLRLVKRGFHGPTEPVLASSRRQSEADSVIPLRAVREH